MKKVVLILTIILTLCCLTGCRKENKILGTWESETGITLSLYKNNECKVDFEEVNLAMFEGYEFIQYNCSYELNDTELNLTYTSKTVQLSTGIFDEREEEIKVIFSDDFESLTSENGKVKYYKKQ